LSRIKLPDGAVTAKVALLRRSGIGVLEKRSNDA
jgi:hypothetical protein